MEVGCVAAASQRLSISSTPAEAKTRSGTDGVWPDGVGGDFQVQLVSAESYIQVEHLKDTSQPKESSRCYSAGASKQRCRGGASLLKMAVLLNDKRLATHPALAQVCFWHRR